MALSNIKLSKFEEYIGDKVDIIKEEKIFDDNKASGNIAVRNFFDTEKECKVIVSLFGENDKFLGAEQIINKKLSAGEIAEADFNLNTTEKIKYVNVDLLTEKEFIEKDFVKLDSIANTDYDKGTITIKADVAPSVADRNIYLAISEDKSFNSDFDKINNGLFVKIPVKAGEKKIAYSFNYNNDASEPCKLGLYVLKMNDGSIVTEKIGEYFFASKESCEQFVKKASSQKIGFDELEMYAQSIGVYIGYADTQNKQNILVNSIYEQRAGITSREKLIEIIEIEKERMDFFLKLKNETSTAAMVNDLIKQYKTGAKLTTKEYDGLNNTECQYVCKKLIGADYESKGVNAFNSDLENLSKESKRQNDNAGTTSGKELLISHGRSRMRQSTTNI